MQASSVAHHRFFTKVIRTYLFFLGAQRVPCLDHQLGRLSKSAYFVVVTAGVTVLGPVGDGFTVSLGIAGIINRQRVVSSFELAQLSPGEICFVNLCRAVRFYPLLARGGARDNFLIQSMVQALSRISDPFYYMASNLMWTLPLVRLA